MPTTQTFRATGLTCGHCAAAVTDEVGALDGVSAVAVDVVSGGESVVVVTADGEVSAGDVAAALEEAGDYALVGGA